jgi:hypothetical protein
MWRYAELEWNPNEIIHSTPNQGAFSAIWLIQVSRMCLRIVKN